MGVVSEGDYATRERLAGAAEEGGGGSAEEEVKVKSGQRG